MNHKFCRVFHLHVQAYNFLRWHSKWLGILIATFFFAGQPAYSWTFWRGSYDVKNPTHMSYYDDAIVACYANAIDCVTMSWSDSKRTYLAVLTNSTTVPPDDCSTNPNQAHCGSQNNNNSCPKTSNPITLSTGRKHLVEPDVDTHLPDGASFTRYYNYLPSPQAPAKSYRDLWKLGSQNTRIDMSVNDVANKITEAHDIAANSSNGKVVSVILRNSYLTAHLDNNAYFFEIDKENNTQIGDPRANFSATQIPPAVDERLTAGTLSITRDSGETYSFNNVSGKLEGVSYASGRQLQYTYTDSGFGYDNVTIVDSYNRTLTLTYLSAHHATLTNAAGQVYHYYFDDDTVTNPRLKVVYPDDTPTTETDNPYREYEHISAYDSNGDPTVLNGALKAIYDNGQLYLSYQYDPGTGLPVHSEKVGGKETNDIVYTLDAANHVEKATLTNSLQKQTTYHFNTIANRQVLTQVEGIATSNCAASNSSYTYDNNGYVASMTDENNHATTYQRDDRGLETSRTEAVGTPEQRTITTEWSDLFRLRSKIIEPNRVTEFTYDSAGNLLNKTVTPPVTP
jgi:hypothetical protein